MQSKSEFEGHWMSRDNRKRLLIMAGICLLIFAVGKYLLSLGTDSLYYKLTLSLNTPDGVKTASTVSKLTLTKGYFPEVGYFFHQEGQALLVDLGATESR